MSIHKIIILYFAAVIIAGCAHSYAPKKWLPDTGQIQTEAYGGWLTIKLKYEADEVLNGEFLASDSLYVYTLYDTLLVIPKNDINSAVLEIDNKNTNDYSAWSCLGMLSTISHGFWLVISLPAWLITGTVITSGESYRDRYEAENPADDYWIEINKFARFPQGLPENIKLESLKKKEVYSK